MALRRKESFQCQRFTAMAACIEKGFSLLFLLGGFLAYDTFGCPIQPYTCFGFTESEGRYGKVYKSWFTWFLSSILAEDSVFMPPTAGTTI